MKLLAGSGWKGQLSYLDYSSGSMTSIPVEIEISEPKGRTLTYAIKYPGEAQHNTTEKIKFSRDDRKLDGELVIAREQNEVGSSAFFITKEVRLEGKSDYFLRNQYSLTR